MNVVLLGAPGAGKGTQAARIREEFSVPHIATGDILRAAVEAETEVGLRAKHYMDSGRLVPDEVVVAIVARRLSEPDCREGWLLDGFPRTRAQAEALERTIAELGLGPVDRVVYLTASPEVVVERLSKRRVCACGATYHLEHMPPQEDEICDRCGGKLVQRDDDRPETVRRRLETYERETAGLVARYRESGMIVEVAGEGDPEEVARSVLAELRSVDAALRQGYGRQPSEALPKGGAGAPAAEGAPAEEPPAGVIEEELEELSPVEAAEEAKKAASDWRAQLEKLAEEARRATQAREAEAAGGVSGPAKRAAKKKSKKKAPKKKAAKKGKKAAKKKGKKKAGGKGKR